MGRDDAMPVRVQMTASRPGAAIRWLTALGLFVSVGMLALGAVVLLDARQDTWRQAEQASNNLVLALERDISRNIAVYDLSLQGAMEAMQQPGIDQISPELRQAAIFDRAASAEYLGSILVLDAKGDIIADSTSIVPHMLNLSDRDYFRAHQARADAGLFVSRAFQSRLRNGDASIAISRRLSGPDGSFRGIVVGTLRLAYFQDMFRTLDLGAAGAVTLARTDGRLVAREPYDPGNLDRDLKGAETFRRFAQSPFGQFTARSSIDGVTRFFTYRQVGALPLLVNVALSVDDVYAAWRRKAMVIGSVMLCLCAGTVTLCLLFRRELLRRMVAEDALTDSANKLAVIAATDGLTGLANRRVFEAELLQEWKRAIRGETSIAVLMLDADWFKSFNDRYGHQEGDAVLRAIAGCLVRNIRRPGDLGARYGGEKFVAVLPETDAAGALGTAERICRSVAELAIPHAGSVLGIATVSIGVAVAHPMLGEEPGAVVGRADAALYSAKAAGRNRAVLAGPEPPAIPDLGASWRARQDELGR